MVKNKPETCEHEAFYAEVKVAGGKGEWALVANVKCTECDTVFEFPDGRDETCIIIKPKPYQRTKTAEAVRATMAEYRRRGLEKAHLRINGQHRGKDGIDTR